MNILVGIFQPGCDITVTNLSVWLAPDKNRSIYIANYTLATSLVGGGLAFICGGAFMQYLGPFLVKLNLPFLLGQHFHNFHSLFIIAGLIRFSAIFGFIPQVRERQSKGVRKLLRDLWVNFKKNSHPVIIHK